jgi:hypothetical protein
LTWEREGLFSVRSLVVIPIVMAMAAVAAWAGLRGLKGHNAPLKELLTAAGITTLAAELSMLPMVLTRGAGQAAVSQAGLLGTVVHLFLSITMAGGAYMMHLVGVRGMFLYLLMAMYWVSLVLVVTASVRAVRRAEPQKST